MKDAQPKAIYLSDYQSPAYAIDKTHLQFDINEDVTLVTSKLEMRKLREEPLVLNGQHLELVSVEVNGTARGQGEYQVDEETLTLDDLPDAFVLQIKTHIKPQDNTALEGLYKSSGMYCTQCEAEGFRRITYFLDRPDVMSEYVTTIIADAKNYPVLLSNGNLIETSELEGGRHKAVWHDPHKKPSYLFALVAGDLMHIEDHFETMNGRNVTLRIYVEPQNIEKCDFAMGALKRSMKWDEDVYGREYDLDIFNIVAVDDFNMGAMENKSLNIFNSSCVLANPATTTDEAFERIEAIVAHEYFHNWTGNRVTCRDWFQLSLKEGFTVYRDAEFTADMGSRTVKRISDATVMRTAQFAEDAGPMAHPIRPSSFIEISNFYTLTIYEKGAEVVRMIANLLGPDLFRKGSDLYFDRHDGQAVTTDDFVKAMEDASGVDLTQFRNWYSQAGTPEVFVSDEYDEATQRYTLRLKQTCRPTPETEQKQPFHIPVKVGLMLPNGEEAKIVCESGADFNPDTQVIGLKGEEETYTFANVEARPVPSLLRGFSAPVKLRYNYSRDQLLFLMGNDTDEFNRWDAAQTLATDILLELAGDVSNNQALVLDDKLITVYKGLLENTEVDPAVIEQLLTLPTLGYLMEEQNPAHVHALISARKFVMQTLANELHAEFRACYERQQDSAAYDYNSEACAKRALKGLCLRYLMLASEVDYSGLAKAQFESADNMTDQSSALRAAVASPHQALAAELSDRFYQQWKEDTLVVNQWLSIQASNDQVSGLDDINQLLEHEAFDIKNPNKVRSVVGVFAAQNPRHFHGHDGQGYDWLAERVIQLDGLNPQIASRLAGPLTKWRRLAEPNSSQMKAALEKIHKESNLSKDVYEVVHKSLVN